MDFSTFMIDYGSIIANYVISATVGFIICYSDEFIKKSAVKERMRYVVPFTLGIFTVILTNAAYRWILSTGYNLPFEYKLVIAAAFAKMSSVIVPALETKNFTKFIVKLALKMAGSLGEKASEALKEAEAEDKKSESKDDKN